jgi:hypothetical protein
MANGYKSQRKYLIYPGAVSVGFMGNYLRKIEWWKLEPHPEFVLEKPIPFCLADPGI